MQGFEISQIWEQAKRLLEASRQEVERCLADVLPGDEIDGCSLRTPSDGRGERLESPLGSAWENESETGSSETKGMMVDNPNHPRKEPNGEDEINAVASCNGNSHETEPLIREGTDESKLTDDIHSESEVSLRLDRHASKSFIPDKHGLNDGFFSIDEFNKQSTFLEQQDVKGALDEEAEDSEEEVNWAADPLAALPPPSKTPLSTRLNGQPNLNSDDDDGPTFGNADLNASDSDTDLEAQTENIGVIHNTNDIKYDDFFAPPLQNARKSHRHRALPKTQPPSQSNLHQPEDDLQHTIAAVRRDIFEDDLSPTNETPGHPPTDPAAHRSTHEARQVNLANEIRALEAANVAKRDWTLAGEARAADRPINSLLEEDLDFERTGKPVPVITNEVSEDIEALIKRRILARDFDEVIRRRPGNLVTGDVYPDIRRGRVEIDDTKPQQSLAEIYEAEHLKATNPEAYTSPADAALRAQHDVITALWNDISADLDALSSLHFRPKPPTANITVVADVPAITMEDARPSGVGGDLSGGTASRLAPSEVYKPGEGRTKAEARREVVSKGGEVVAREEMEKDERRRTRRRERQRRKKAGGPPSQVTTTVRPSTAAADEKKKVLAQLKRGNVRVIGRRGEISDVHGRAVKKREHAPRTQGGESAKPSNAGAYKL